MDKKAEAKRRWRQFRLRSSVFLKKNGLYVALAVCLAVIGGTAALIFAGSEKPNKQVEQSYDQRLDDVTNTGSATIAPRNTPKPTKGPNVDVSLPSTEPTIVPQMTPAPQTTVNPTAAPVVLNAPLEGNIIRVYAMDSLIFSKTLEQWMTHSGVDIAAPKGTEVRCVLNGVVESVSTDDMLGVTVVISHENGMKSVYANLKEEPPVSTGQRIESRAVIGYVGDTAISECAEESHLHFELYINGLPVDPCEYVMFERLES